MSAKASTSTLMVDIYLSLGDFTRANPYREGMPVRALPARCEIVVLNIGGRSVSYRVAEVIHHLLDPDFPAIPRAMHAIVLELIDVPQRDGYGLGC